jgi:adenylate/nucleoside-diphosphate kinase
LESSSSTDEYDDSDNEAVIFEDLPGPSTKRFKPNRGHENFISEKLAIVLDKCVISDRNAVHLLIATAEALGKEVNNLIVNRTSIRRARIKYRRERAEKIRRDYNLVKGEAIVVHWDGKLLSALTGKDLVERLVASVNSCEQLLGVPALNTGTGRDQADMIY